ncbi:hypothetical protein GN956_G15577 [Arapaima gigas]
MTHRHDTERAASLLRSYKTRLTSPEEKDLRENVEKVSSILSSPLFHALLAEWAVEVSPGQILASYLPGMDGTSYRCWT